MTEKWIKWGRKLQAISQTGLHFTESESEIAFFAESEIPNELSKSRVTKSQLIRFFEYYRTPDLPTDFD